MNKIKKQIRSEMDNEFLACVHAMSMIFIYGFELYVYGIKSITFAVIFQMFVLGYVIAWVQKLLFIQERVYEGMEYKIRVVLWNVLPVVITGICGIFFNWYRAYPDIIWIVFLIIMFIYYIMIWAAIQIFYHNETDELNEKLTILKNEHRRKGV